MDAGSTEGLAAALHGWSPPPRVTSRRIDPWAVAALADLLDAPGPSASTLPPLWHWVVLLDHPRHAEIGHDGHPADGPFLPPIPDRRRMIAGGRLQLRAPIPIGARLDCHSAVVLVRVRTGRTGEMAFVTVRHDLSVDGVLAATEEQDVVYRSAPDGAPRRGPDSGPGPADPRATDPPAADPPVAEHRRALDVDAVRLFRFSALTYNAHRIHYDLPYATEVEGYGGLVVHGPLLALLALELPRTTAPDHRLTGFDYRLVRPSFAPARLTATAHVRAERWELAAGTENAAPSLTATAVLQRDR